MLARVSGGSGLLTSLQQSINPVGHRQQTILCHFQMESHGQRGDRGQEKLLQLFQGKEGQCTHCKILPPPNPQGILTFSIWVGKRRHQGMEGQCKFYSSKVIYYNILHSPVQEKIKRSEGGGPCSFICFWQWQNIRNIKKIWPIIRKEEIRV